MSMQCHGKELLLRVQRGRLRSSMVHNSVHIGEDGEDSNDEKLLLVNITARTAGGRKRTAVFGLGTFFGFYLLGPDGMNASIIIIEHH